MCADVRVFVKTLVAGGVTKTREFALNLIGSLARDQAEAVLLRVVAGLTARGAARVAGKRTGAIRTAAYRGLKRLAKRMERANRQAAKRAQQDR